jgi:NAD(P)-dependent dehydrogenase (short-subunit alcohol dehydrogenase family)
VAGNPGGTSPGARPIAVVTGASRGIGAGMAAYFAARGFALGLCARTAPVPPDGAAALSAAVDVTDPDAVDGFADAVVDRFGRIDLWINNAGVLEPIGPLADADPVALGRHVATNVLGVAYGTAAFVRHVRTRAGPGSLVNVSSGAATSPYRGWAAYCASKAAVEMLTEVVGLEEQGSGLAAYAVAPGVVDTDMQALIRGTSAAAFPDVERFRRLGEDGGLRDTRVGRPVHPRAVRRPGHQVGAGAGPGGGLVPGTGSAGRRCVRRDFG